MDSIELHTPDHASPFQHPVDGVDDLLALIETIEGLFHRR